MSPKVVAKLLIVSAILGVLCGLGIDIFIRILHAVSSFIWNDLMPNAQHRPVATILITVAGGVVMGICVKYFGTNPGVGFEAVLVNVKKDGELGFKQIKRVVVNAFAGLVTGASIGPENPIIVVGGFMGNFLAKQLKMAKDQTMAIITIAIGGSLGILLSSPVAGPVMLTENLPTKDKNTNMLLVFASMVSASVGFAIYLALKAPLITQDKLVPTYSGFKAIHLLYALIIGVVGTAIGLTLKWLIERLGESFSLFDKHPIARGALVGLFIGVCGAAFPLVLFDGSAQLSQIVSNTAQYSIVMLLTLGIVRLITTAVALAGGYQGGNIFPTIFISGAIGLAISMIFPFIPAPVAMMACMVPAMYVFLPMPLFTIFLFTEISSFSLIPVMSLALTSAYVILLVLQQRTKTSTATA